MKRTTFLLAVILLTGTGCQTTGIPLYDLRGKQWVWPFFAQDQPTVLAFWNTDEVQCLDDFPVLNALDNRESSVQLVTVCASGDRNKINKWLGYERCRFVVLLDSERRLASRLDVTGYPTYIFFDVNANEIGRYLDVSPVHNWFDRTRWLERAGAGESRPD